MVCQTPNYNLMIPHFIKSILPAFIAAASIGAPWQFITAEETSAKELFKLMEPSVVLITDEEGGGSGVVIDASGLILTNYHVVNTPLDITVEATVVQNGQTTRKKFPKAKVIKAHITNDLALLKVDAPGLKFKPAKLSKNDQDAVAGGTCYAMGYPFLEDGAKPVITITRGIISAVKREVNGVPYIQLDAAINPGNSGGALVNEKGILIGIPTLRFEGSDRIGLASPTINVKMDQFVDPIDRKGDPAEAKRLAEIADSLYTRDALSLGTNDDAIAVAIYLQRQAVSLEPKNPNLSLSLAWMYRRLQKYALARAYAENTLRLAPDNFRAGMLLADMHSALREPAKAAQQRLKCLAKLPNDTEVSIKKSLFENLAAELSAMENHVSAVYVVSWGLAEMGGTVGAAQKLILQKAARSLPGEYIEKIMNQKSGHSMVEMSELARNAPTHKQRPAPEPSPSTADFSTKPIKPISITKALALEAGWTATLQDAPPGVIYHAHTGSLEWKPTPFASSTSIRVLMLLKNHAGEEKFEIHEMKLSDATPP